MSTKQNSEKQSITLDCPIVSNGNIVTGKDGKTLSVTIGTGNVSQSVGKLLETVKPGTEIRVLGCTVKIPSGTFSQQFNKIVIALVAAAFKNCEEYEQPKTDEGKALIEGLRAKLPFKSLEQKEVKRVMKIREDNYRAKTKAYLNEIDSRKENKVLIEETATYKAVNKAYKEGGRPAVVALLNEMKGIKVIGWNS